MLTEQTVAETAPACFIFKSHGHIPSTTPAFLLSRLWVTELCLCFQDLISEMRGKGQGRVFVKYSSLLSSQQKKIAKQTRKRKTHKQDHSVMPSSKHSLSLLCTDRTVTPSGRDEKLERVASSQSPQNTHLAAGH